MKRLQAEWKTVGPVRRNKSEVVWNRFRDCRRSLLHPLPQSPSDHARHEDRRARGPRRRARAACGVGPERAGSRRTSAAASHDVEPERADSRCRIQGADRSLARGADAQRSTRHRRPSPARTSIRPWSFSAWRSSWGASKRTLEELERRDRRACRTPSCSPPGCGLRSRPTRWAAGSTRKPSGAQRLIRSKTRRRPGSGWPPIKNPAVEGLDGALPRGVPPSRRACAAASVAEAPENAGRPSVRRRQSSEAGS